MCVTKKKKKGYMISHKTGINENRPRCDTKVDRYEQTDIDK